LQAVKRQISPIAASEATLLTVTNGHRGITQLMNCRVADREELREEVGGDKKGGN
jgi:hypothetical protein